MNKRITQAAQQQRTSAKTNKAQVAPPAKVTPTQNEIPAPADAAQKPNPYLRMLKKLDADREGTNNNQQP